jgi:hypothetical protein
LILVSHIPWQSNLGRPCGELPSGSCLNSSSHGQRPFRLLGMKRVYFLANIQPRLLLQEVFGISLNGTSHNVRVTHTFAESFQRY